MGERACWGGGGDGGGAAGVKLAQGLVHLLPLYNSKYNGSTRTLGV